jgi:hypothetical protein
MRQKNLFQQIINDVLSGKTKEPFRASDFSFLTKSPSFLAKHSLGNGKYSELFIRVSRGAYKIK